MVVTEKRQDMDSASIEVILARLLRIGSGIAASLLCAGVLAMSLGFSNLVPRLFSSGVLVLLSTPVMRVMVAGIVFVKKKDWLFSFFCFVVLCTLTAGFLR